uniref:IS66 family transposase n=3 Tax=Escherichia coli TaxID=562 RepID=UPI002882F33F
TTFLNSNENFSMHPQFLVWCLTFGAQFKNDGHYFCGAGGNTPDGLNEPVTEIRGLPVSERLAVRQMQSKPLLTSLYKLMQEKEHTLSKKCRLRDAFRYIRKHWVALCNFCDDGLAEADNNAAERALRAVCLGKKNFMFFGSDHGGERGALLYGLIGTCRLNGIDPEAYLRHILSVLPEWPSNRVDELLPWNVVLTNK